MLRFLSAAFLLLTLLAAPSVRAQEGERLAVETFTLENGLKVILHVDRRLPLVCTDVWYHVGSREEREGRSGFAHLFEHLMFMGTERVPNGQFDAILEAGGAWSNASTDYDRTDYYNVGPSPMLPTILWLEADRMESLGKAMTQEKLDLQRAVVQNEIRETYDNAPYGPAELRMQQELYPPGHPYHHHVIGSHADVGAATVEDVKQFFATYYVPNNATLVVAGDFDPAAARAIVERLFGSIPRADDPPRPPTPLFLFDAERRITLPDEVQRPRLVLTWHTPPYFASGDAEMDLIASLLTDGRNGRLYERLVHEERVALDVAAWQGSMRLGSLFRLQVTAASGVDLDAIEAAVDEELARLATEGPSEDELARIRVGYESDTVSGLQELLSRADLLNTYDAYLGEPDRLAWDLDRYRRATPQTVKDAALRWLVGRPRLVTRIVPKASGAAGPNPRDERPAGPASTAFVPPVPQAFQLGNGLTVWHLDRPGLPLVAARLLVPSGSAEDGPGRAGRALLAGQMLLEGAGDLDTLAFDAARERLGARLWVDVGRDTTTLGLQSLASRADEAFGLLALALESPRFDASAWDRLQAQHLERLAQIPDDPEALADRVAVAALFPAPDAWHGATAGTPASVSALDLDALRTFHRARHVPAGAVLLLAGDLRAEEARALVVRHLGDWVVEGTAPAPAPAPPPAPSGTRVVLVERPGAEQTVVRLLLPAPAWADARDGALRTANEILGGSFTSRLNAKLREAMGATYGVYSSLVLGDRAGWIQVATPVEADATKDALEAIFAEIDRLRAGDLDEGDLDRARATFRSGLVQAFEDLGGTLGAFSSHARYGAGPGDLAKDEAALAALDVAAVKGAAAKAYVEDGMVLVLVGDPEVIRAAVEGRMGAGPIVLRPAEVLGLP